MGNNSLPPYFQKYLDQKFEGISMQISELHLTLCGNGKKGLVKEIEEFKTWKNQLTAKWSLILLVGGTVFGFIFTLVKDVLFYFWTEQR